MFILKWGSSPWYTRDLLAKTGPRIVLISAVRDSRKVYWNANSGSEAPAKGRRPERAVLADRCSAGAPELGTRAGQVYMTCPCVQPPHVLPICRSPQDAGLPVWTPVTPSLPLFSSLSFESDFFSSPEGNIASGQKKTGLQERMM